MWPTVEDFMLPTSTGEIPARRYAPDGATGAMLWIHGGGWVICDLDSHDAMCRMLANASGCEVYAIHYRLAPEHPSRRRSRTRGTRSSGWPSGPAGSR